jgi:hypothetical protein
LPVNAQNVLFPESAVPWDQRLMLETVIAREQ